MNTETQSTGLLEWTKLADKFIQATTPLGKYSIYIMTKYKKQIYRLTRPTKGADIDYESAEAAQLESETHYRNLLQSLAPDFDKLQKMSNDR